MLTFTARHFDSQVPQPGELDQADRAILTKVENAFGQIGEMLDRCSFKAAISETMALAREANRYLDEKAPWLTIKTDRQATATTIFVILRVIDSLKTLFYPFMPISSSALHRMLGYDTDLLGRQYIETFQEERKSHVALCYDASGLVRGWQPSSLPVGQRLRQPHPLFKKLEPSIVEEEIERMAGH